MNIQFSLRKTTEAGLIVTALAALFLAGCGGGGGGGSGATSTSTGGTGGTTTSTTTGISNAYLTELSNGIGLRYFSAGVSGVAGALPIGTIITATAAAGGSYTVNFNPSTYSPSSWTPKTTSNYFLNSAGNWVTDTTTTTMTPNADGTITFDIAELGGPVSSTAVAVDLSGLKLNTGATYKLINPAIPTGSAVVSVGVAPAIAANGNGVAAASSVIPATATYPTGSAIWLETGVALNQNAYAVYPTQSYFSVRTPAGTLASISLATANTFTTASPLCYGNNNLQLVYSATQPATANTARFDVYINNNMATCPAVAVGATIFAKVDMLFSTVRTQAIAEFTNYSLPGTSPFNMGNASFPYPAFLATVNGVLYTGIKTPSGRSFDAENASLGKLGGYFNKTAMDAIMTAAGITKF